MYSTFELKYGKEIEKNKQGEKITLEVENNNY